MTLKRDSAIIHVLQPQMEIVYCNRAWDRFAPQNSGGGLCRRFVLGTSVLNITPDVLKPFYLAGYEAAHKRSKPWECDYECSSPSLDRYFHMRVIPLPESYC
jgi:hypothetical protein